MSTKKLFAVNPWFVHGFDASQADYREAFGNLAGVSANDPLPMLAPQYWEGYRADNGGKTPILRTVNDTDTVKVGKETVSKERLAAVKQRLARCQAWRTGNDATYVLRAGDPDKQIPDVKATLLETCQAAETGWQLDGLSVSSTDAQIVAQGKALATVKYIVKIDGMRRFGALPGIYLAETHERTIDAPEGAKTAKGKDKGPTLVKPSFSDWQVFLDDSPVDEADLMIGRILHNSTDNGAAGMTPKDYVVAVCKLMATPKYRTLSETDIGRLLGISSDAYRGTRQAAHKWARLNNKFPTLNIVGRMTMPVPDKVKGVKGVPYVKGGYFPLTTKQPNALLDPLFGIDKQAKNDAIAKILGERASAAEYLKGATPDQMETFLEYLCTERINTPSTTLGAEKVKSAAKELANSESAGARAITAIATGDAEGLGKAIAEIQTEAEHVKTALDGAAELTKERDELVKQVERLTRENTALKAQIAKLTAKRGSKVK